MIVVIQCAARKAADAGHLRTQDGRRVMFVANPDLAPRDGDCIYARPDDVAETGTSWRTVLRQYNENPGDNRLGLLPAWRLYRNPTYEILAERCGLDRLYILSAGWGLIPADFLTPNYDITFSAGQNVQKFKRRRRHDTYRDFRMLSTNTSEPILFFGGKDYIRLFCRLTADLASQRTVFYAGREPAAPGCRVQPFGKPYTNWHYQCAKAYVEENTQLN